MIIGIDVDGVLTDIERFMCDSCTKFCYENNIEMNIKWGEYDTEKAFTLTHEQEMKFWNEYLEEYARDYCPREYAVEVINKLRENNKIYLITARDEYGLPKESYGKMHDFVKEWIDKYKIYYDKLFFSPDKEKLDCCIKNNVDIMIEDSPTNIEYMSKKMNVFCYDCGYNHNIVGKNITRVYSWYDILAKVSNMNK